MGVRERHTISGHHLAQAARHCVHMTQPHDTPAPPGLPAWDISYTRMARAVIPLAEACTHHLARRFHALGLTSSIQLRPMPRGLSTFLALVGQRGLVCFVDITLVDGMAVGHGPCAWLEMQLLDACGDVVSTHLSSDTAGHRFDPASMAQAHIADSLDRAATGVYVATLAHFDLLQPQARHA